jgi:hypothetical protein
MSLSRRDLDLFAIPAAAPAIPPNPNAAAISAISAIISRDMTRPNIGLFSVAPFSPQIVPLWVFIQVPKDGAARIPDTRDLGFRKGLNRQVLQPAMEGVEV